ncbi:TetR/AcrR family transcriptional regulator, partial [Rhodospirillum rubrum]
MPNNEADHPRRPRRSQEARSAETRGKLIAATLDVLLAEGYHALTTQRICDVAGVSRGAMLHHFPSKVSLVVTAIDHLLTTATEEIRDQAKRVHGGEISLEAFLDYLWREQFSGRLFYLTLEHVTLARTHDEIRAPLIPVVKRFHAALDETWTEVFPTTSLAPGGIATVLNLTLCLMRGMGLQTVLRPNDDAYYQSLLSAWKALLPGVVEGRFPLSPSALSPLSPV